MLPFFGEQVSKCRVQKRNSFVVYCQSVVGTWRSHFENSNLSHPKPFSFSSRILCKNVTTKDTSKYIYIYIYIVSFLRIKIQGSNFYSSVELLNNSFLVFKQYYTFFYIFPSTHVVKNYKQHYSNPYLNLF